MRENIIVLQCTELCGQLSGKWYIIIEIFAIIYPRNFTDFTILIVSGNYKFRIYVTITTISCSTSPVFCVRTHNVLIANADEFLHYSSIDP